LKGALLNLVNNALQACGANARIELGAVRSNNQICLTVTDNGDGISDEIRSRIFEPFFTTRPQGTGLGLAVVRSVADVHNGEVLVDSGPKGTTFAICLPDSVDAPVSRASRAGRKLENCNV
jgi:two-component system sensor histidine kinase FlrB